MMWPDPPKNGREAFYQAVAELGVHRDLLQMQIGTYLQAVKELRDQVVRTCPMRLERFDKIEEQTTEGLMVDLTGDEALMDATKEGETHTSNEGP